VSAQPSELELQLVASLVKCGTFKTCGCCGRRFTKPEWDALPMLGEYVDDIERLCMKNCSCDSTMAIVTETFAANDFEVPPTLCSAQMPLFGDVDDGDHLDALTRAERP
jgi:hypothetical protein